MGPVQFLSGLIEENGLPYLMSKFSKLCLWIPSLLQVKVRPVIESLNGNLLTTPTGEENKGEGCIPLPHGLEELNPVHDRHLIVGDDGIIPAGFHMIKYFMRGCGD
ncbi:MAG: hypothetical protein BWY05_00747 [Euryarchaeota archaeon ADurb.Bin165]|nr:MAG: hypothetical protein BWY05_00747 [Euryarchaeota archaeon ADurb.Bin165]